jgi:HSP20 family protein
MTRSIRLARILSMADQLTVQLQSLQFSSYHPRDLAWQPAVNVYASADRLEVCMDLAGVRKQDIRVEVEPRRLVVSGCRNLPENPADPPPCSRILVMEIADGQFERRLEFPVDVDTTQVKAWQDNGWLWISMPRIQVHEEAHS